MVFGYYAPWSGTLDELRWDRLTHLAVFWVDLNSDGTVSDTHNWHTHGPRAVALAAPHGVKVQLSLTCFDDAVMNAVLPSASRRATLVSTLGDLVDLYGADGVSVDCEGMDAGRRAELVALVTELKARVAEVSVALPAVDWSDAYDEAALSRVADQLFIMGYDYHWGGGDPGPVAPLYGGGIWSSWSLDRTVRDTLATGADPAKIVLGLPLYGRTWPTADTSVPGRSTGTASSVTFTSGAALMATHGRLYDSSTETPYAFPSSRSQTWCDDTPSLQPKIRHAIDAGLGGIGFWALNYEDGDPAFWAMVEAETTLPEPDPDEPTPGGDSGAPDPAAEPWAEDVALDTGPGAPLAEAVDPPAEVAQPEGRRIAADAGCAGGGVGVMGVVGVMGRRRRRGGGRKGER
jgi:GH18 family chitinase